MHWLKWQKSIGFSMICEQSIETLLFIFFVKRQCRQLEPIKVGFKEAVLDNTVFLELRFGIFLNLLGGTGLHGES